jgi:multidrug resistance efflux pump
MDIPRRPPRRRSAAVGLALGALAIAAATLGLGRLRAADPVVERAAVLIDRVERGPMLRAVQGQGTLVPEDIRFISAVTAGRIGRVRLRPGAPVQPDSVVVDLVNPDVELTALQADREVAAAAADLASLGATLENQRLQQESTVEGTRSEMSEAQRRADADGDLARQGFLSALETARSRDQADTLKSRLGIEEKRLVAQRRGIGAQLAARREQLERLRSIAAFHHRELESLHVRAGVVGVVQELPLQVGQSVAAGALLAKVADPARLKAEVRVPEGQAKEVRVGQAVQIDTHNGVVRGRVSRVEPAVQAGTVKVEVTAEGAWPEGARPDLTVDGIIELERIADTVFVTRPAVADASAAVQLWKLSDDSTAVRVPVELGRLSARTVEIRAGLGPGDRVIVSDMSQWDHVARVQLR